MIFANEEISFYYSVVSSIISRSAYMNLFEAILEQTDINIFEFNMLWIQNDRSLLKYFTELTPIFHWNQADILRSSKFFQFAPRHFKFGINDIKCAEEGMALCYRI